MKRSGKLKAGNRLRTHANHQNTVETPDAIRRLIARTVDSVIRELFPERYLSICHDYAIIGSNVASIVLGRQYRPVAGLAVIDCGNGCLMNFTDDHAFFKEDGMAYHCWFESYPDMVHAKEIVDLSFVHKDAFAAKHGLTWQKKPPTYLWGNAADLLIKAELGHLPRSFPDGKIWLRETPNGLGWITQRVASHVPFYVETTALVLNKLKPELLGADTHHLQSARNSPK